MAVYSPEHPRPHPLQGLYLRTSKARLLQLLIDNPNGLKGVELATRVFGNNDKYSYGLLWTNLTKLRQDLPAGWEITSAIPAPHVYKLNRIDLNVRDNPPSQVRPAKAQARNAYAMH